MEKLICMILLLAITIVAVNPNIEANAAIEKDYYVVEQSITKSSSSLNETVIEKLQKGIPVTIYSENVNMLELLPIFRELKLPVVMSLEDTIIADKLEKNPGQVDLPVYKKMMPTSDNKKIIMDKITPTVSFVPIDGNIQVSITSLSHKEDKSFEDMLSLSASYIENTDMHQQLVSLENELLKTNVSAKASGTTLDSIRKTTLDYDDFYFAGYTHNNLMVSKTIIDYFLTDWNDSNSDYDHITYEAVAQLYTFENINQGFPPYCTKKYVTKTDNYYTGDLLVDFDPSNSFDLDDGDTVSFSIGYPASISASFEWAGNNGVDFEGVGNKSNQLYYNVFERPMGLSDTIVDHKFTTMYKLDSNNPYRINIDTYFGVGVENYTMEYNTYKYGNWDTLTLYH